jgi:NadR type nicotinamide-nucleotide adenylyltransferase
MTRGFLLGKFLPPHAGHVFLCDFARAYCDELTILVCTLDCDPIPGELRFQWMREMFPDCRVLHLAEDVPQEPADHSDFWDIWRGIVERFHPEPIDFVFASEDYGHRLAAEARARFVPVDISREAVPVSGEAIRADPFGNWRYIPPPVRPYFVEKVCVFGPESAGKTTLARDLAARLDTVHVPEYGRIYTDAFGTDVGNDDLLAIARGHMAATAAAARQANRVLVMDTDPVLTAVWSDMLTGARDPWFESLDDTADLYLLTGIDMDWEDDGTRYFPDGDTRRRFHAACRAELERRGLAFLPVEGSREERLAKAVAAVEDAFGL